MSKHSANSGRGPFRLLQPISAYWTRGAVYIAFALVIWYLLKPIIPSVLVLTNDAKMAATALVFVIVGPLVVGWIAAKLINPLFRNWRRFHSVTKWEDRIVEELSPNDNRSFPVVLVPWPSEDVMSLALLSNIYNSPNGKGELASVYIPDTPNPSSGSLRVVPVDQLVYVDWAMKDLMQYHMSFGSSGPPFSTK